MSAERARGEPYRGSEPTAALLRMGYGWPLVAIRYTGGENPLQEAV